MPPQNKLLNLDVFSKTVEDARIKTTSGGIVTIITIITAIWLIISEFIDYKKIVYRPELIVDKARSERLNINLDITFPHIPCDLLTMDIMDISGEIQGDINHGIVKIRLDEKGNELSSIKMNMGEVDGDEEDEAIVLPKDYCGPCYGALDQSVNENIENLKDRICCNSCSDVREAYANKGWAFYDGTNVEQCEREHFKEKLAKIEQEGCRIKGIANVNKVAGNFHFAPGKSHTKLTNHVHDLSFYDRNESPFSLAHRINNLSFGPPPQEISIDNNNVVDKFSNPLNGIEQGEEKNKYFAYSYYLKVVATRLEKLSGNIIETNQYSATCHARPLQGGRDEDHPNTFHSRGGLPGVFFNYDISAMKIINREVHNRTFGSFLLGFCSIVGGVLTVGAIIDKGVWEADKALRRKKSL